MGLVRYLERLVWDTDRAHDLAQETFARALDREPDNPRAWIFTVATNLARDEARKAVRRRKHLTLLKSEAELRTQEDGAVAALERRERSVQLRKALETLSERDRQSLLLWSAGFNYGEIARETGLSRGAIGTTLARARRKLVAAYGGLESSNAARG